MFSAQWADYVSTFDLNKLLDRAKIRRKAFRRLINLMKIIEHEDNRMLNRQARRDRQ